LTPSNAEINAALEPGSDPAAVLGALRRARSTLDDMDAALADLRRPRRAARLATLIRALRSRIMYGAMALVVLGLLTLGGYALLRQDVRAQARSRRRDHAHPHRVEPVLGGEPGLFDRGGQRAGRLHRLEGAVDHQAQHLEQHLDLVPHLEHPGDQLHDLVPHPAAAEH